MNDFVSDYKSLHVLIIMSRRGNLLYSLSQLTLTAPSWREPRISVTYRSQLPLRWSHLFSHQSAPSKLTGFWSPKIPFPPSDLESEQLTQSAKKINCSAKSALQAISFHIAMPILAKLRRDDFAPFWRRVSINFQAVFVSCKISQQ